MQSTKRAARPVRAILAASLALAALPAAAQTYTQTVFFGDSLSDAGFFQPMLPASVQAVTGKFTTNPSYVWAQFVADFYGTNGDVAWQQTPTGVALRPGTNYAIGGARVNTGATSLTSQVNAYLAATGGRADPNALYTVWGGGNDLRDAAAPGANVPVVLGTAVAGTVSLVARLQAAGARYVLVPTAPDIGLSPEARAGGPAAQAGATALATMYNNGVFGAFASAGIRVIPLDTFHFVQEVVADPALYGLVNVTSPACTQPTWYQPICNPTSLVTPSAPDTYLFADPIHPTSATHRLLGEFAISVLEAPRQIAVLPLSEAMVGRSRAERVAAHLSVKPQGDGMRWWGDIRGDSQRYHDPNHFDGFGPTLTFGVDWTSGNLVYGAFAGYGVQEIDFGRRGGDFKQTDATLGGAIGWYGDALWVNGQASWSKLAYDVDRQVHLGPATRTHSGSPDGDNLSLGVSAGWNMEHGKLTHGPVLSVLSQKIEVDGYAEDSTLSTALSYPQQDYDSLLASLGWQSSYAISDHVHPYARVTLDREFEDAPEEAFAQSRSLPGTLPYAVPGLERDERYGTLQFGVRTRLLGLDANVGASATFNQGGGSDATMFVTFGGRF